MSRVWIEPDDHIVALRVADREVPREKLNWFASIQPIAVMDRTARAWEAFVVVQTIRLTIGVFPDPRSAADAAVFYFEQQVEHEQQAIDRAHIELYRDAPPGTFDSWKEHEERWNGPIGPAFTPSPDAYQYAEQLAAEHARRKNSQPHPIGNRAYRRANRKPR